MNANISVLQLNKLKSEFKAHLHDGHPEWTDNTISMIGLDAFFALNNSVGIDFWANLVSDELLLSARDRIFEYLESTQTSGNSNERANGCLSAMRYLKQFLDAKHPTLANDWSGKVISDVYLKSDFQAWMKKQKQSNGDSYSPNTINAYTTALKNLTVKLELGDAVYSDLFFYTSLEEFKIAHANILGAPKLAAVEQANGNKAYSSGLVMYERFLKALGEPSAWIFQGNPKIL